MRKINTKTTKVQINEMYRFAASKDAAQVLLHFKTTVQGLDEDEVAVSQQAYGENRMSQEKRQSLISQIWHAFITPFTVVLILLAAVSFVTDYVLAVASDKDITAVVIIMTMVIISGVISLIQEMKSSQAAEKLADLVEVTATVKRYEQPQAEMLIEDIVCGDIIHLSAGDMLPADVRIIKAKDLFISQAAMTGESEPVEKIAETDRAVEAKSVTEYHNIAFMGSNVISGTAVAIVVAVGDATLFGHIAKDVSKKKERTTFDVGVSSVSWLLIRFMALMAPTVFVINGVTKGDWVEAFFFALSIAVGLTPEMLPMIVTSNLVKGANGMAKEGTIIKNLHAIQNFGAIDVLCTDKTGTLTQDKIILEYHLDLDGEEDPRVLKHAFFNSYYQTGLKNLMDRAIIDVAAEELHIQIDQYEKVDEIPFDFKRRRMSVVIKDHENKTQLITKGAVEEMLAISRYVDYQGIVTPLTDQIKQTILTKVSDLNSDGLRVIAVAQKTNPSAVGEFSVSDEYDMVLMGYLAFLDPPKETTAPALSALTEHHVSVKVLTGDNEMITRSVCKQVGIDASQILYGTDLERVDIDELRTLVEQYDIFVKLSPQQKTDIVKALRLNGHTVGFMGDGINDAPAMKAADVGISVDTAVDIAKESADVILLDKDLMVLEKGIVAGRHVFGNIVKYIKMTASSNFGNIFSVLIASVFLPFLPMLPLQILFLNLIYDVTCISLPWDHVDAKYVQQPRTWNAKSISRFMYWFGPTSSLFDLLTFAILYFLICPMIVGGDYGTLDVAQQGQFIMLFHAGWFVQSLCSQTLVLHLLRTAQTPFTQSRMSAPVLVVTTLGIIVGIVLPYTNFGWQLGLAALPLFYYLFLVAVLALYFVLVTVVKKLFITKYGELL